ncbi:MAG: hypothetical protein NVSMB4_03590 [Acidimicrobiales bacterium]
MQARDDRDRLWPETGGGIGFLLIPGGPREGDDLRTAINLGSARLPVGEVAIDCLRSSSWTDMRA